jgi:biopolymer transport protein ExbB
VVVAGLVESEHGVEAAQEAMEGASALQRMKLEKRLAYLGTVGNNAPFIGLLGTVIGILAAFDELSKGTIVQAVGATQVANQQVANQALMGRISEALVATAIGILIAIPAVAAFNAFQRIVRGTLANTEALGHLLLAHLKSTPLPAGEATTEAVEAKAERSGARKDLPEDSERN